MIYEYESLRRGLVGAWCPSLGATSARIIDRSPYRQNATLNTTTYSGSGSGVAFNTNGSTSNVTIADAYWLKPTTAVTVTAWAFARAQSGFVVFKKNSRGSSFEGYTLGAATNVWQSVLSSVGGTQTILTATKTLNVWTHLAFTFSRPAMSIYVNGRLANTATHNFDIDHSATDVVIGRSNQSVAQVPFNGLIDDVRIYNRALTASEVALLASRRGIGLVPRRPRRLRSPAVGSTLALNVGGTWKTTQPWIKVGGTWKQATPYINQNGTWK